MCLKHDNRSLVHTKPATQCSENFYEVGFKCLCFKCKSIVNKKNELNIMVEDVDIHIIGITESWADKDIIIRC